MLVTVVAAVTLLWLVLLFLVSRRVERRVSLREALWLVREMGGLLGPLAADPGLPRRVRVRRGSGW